MGNAFIKIIMYLLAAVSLLLLFAFEYFTGAWETLFDGGGYIFFSIIVVLCILVGLYMIYQLWLLGFESDDEEWFQQYSFTGICFFVASLILTIMHAVNGTFGALLLVPVLYLGITTPIAFIISVKLAC